VRRALAWLVALPALAFPPAAGAQGRWIDIGSGTSYTIAVEHEPESRERFPPYAFGTFSPGNWVYSELLAWPCAGLPSPEPCAGTTFVRAFQAYLDTGSCPCTGVLFLPVELELRYDPARVTALGAREEDLRLLLFDADLGEWVDLPDQRVLPARDLIAGSHVGSARQFYLIQVRPQPGSTWGRIKAQWGGSP
jgi:hypothetical protein